MSIHDKVFQDLQVMLNHPGVDKRRALNAALRLLSKWRATLINNTLVHSFGSVVLGGPFTGMKFAAQSTEGCNAPKLLGCYERELHPVIERIVATPYEVIVDIGCAEGFYAIGLARRMAQTRVLACDTNEKAQTVCRQLAEENGVAERVTVTGTFAGEDFSNFEGLRTLVFCDIEGAEKQLLDPGAYPALRRMDILVECHDCLTPGISREIAGRFQSTHQVEQIDRRMSSAELPDSFHEYTDLDRLLATWEWRKGPTPWLFITAK
jgi:SAM-dependent methyltransferase